MTASAITHGWQPIKTAPKDGSPILLWLWVPVDRNHLVAGLCDRLAIGFWQHGRWGSIEVADCGTMGGQMTGWMADWCCLDLVPSHWMPVPGAPA